ASLSKSEIQEKSTGFGREKEELILRSGERIQCMMGRMVADGPPPNKKTRHGPLSPGGVFMCIDRLMCQLLFFISQLMIDPKCAEQAFEMLASVVIADDGEAQIVGRALHGEDFLLAID